MKNNTTPEIPYIAASMTNVGSERPARRGGRKLILFPFSKRGVDEKKKDGTSGRRWPGRKAERGAGVALYCGLSRFGNFALWSRSSDTGSKERAATPGGSRESEKPRRWEGEKGCTPSRTSECHHSLRASATPAHARSSARRRHLLARSAGYSVPFTFDLFADKFFGARESLFLSAIRRLTSFCASRVIDILVANSGHILLLLES